MKCVAVLLALCAAATAAPQPYRPIYNFGGGGSATGQANSNIVSGTQSGPFGSSQINSLSSSASGSASGGGSSFNRASAQQSSGQGIFGSFNSANTNAESVQNTRRRFFG